MLMQILSRTPVYVWALLAGLLALGLMQTRTRRVNVARAVSLPATLLGLGLWSLLPGIQALPLVALLWLVALSAGAAFGRWLPQAAGTRWLAEHRQFLLPGSWLPLALILSIFSLRYTTSVAFALHPAWRAQWLWQAPLAVVFGALAGLSLGRAWGLLDLRRTAA